MLQNIHENYYQKRINKIIEDKIASELKRFSKNLVKSENNLGHTLSVHQA